MNLQVLLEPLTCPGDVRVCSRVGQTFGCGDLLIVGVAAVAAAAGANACLLSSLFVDRRTFLQFGPLSRLVVRLISLLGAVVEPFGQVSESGGGLLAN